MFLSGKNFIIPRTFVSILFIILSALLALQSLTGCMAVKAFNEGDNGTAISLAPGDSFQVALESNQTTGYGWQLSEETDQSVLALLSSDYKIAKTALKLTGSGGTEFFTFRALAKGKTELILEYARPWEKDAKPDKVYKLIISVD